MQQENFIITNGEKNIMSTVLVDIEKRLFSQPNILLNRYADMFKNYDSNKYSFMDKGCEVQMINSSSFRLANCVYLKNFGLDIPLLLELKQCLDQSDYMYLDNNSKISLNTTKRKKTVMIVSQNPKRIETPNGLLSLSSPFGIHCMGYRTTPQKGFMTGFINLLFTNPIVKYVYITDATKLYGECSLCNQCTFCNSTDNDSTCINIVSKDILSAEINSINPDYIITFGAEASNKAANILNIEEHKAFDESGLEKTAPVKHTNLKSDKPVNVTYHKYPIPKICNRQIYKNLTDCNFFDLK